jgi:23S rRNA (uridine2552-2'-O)-methyltransferase
VRLGWCRVVVADVGEKGRVVGLDVWICNPAKSTYQGILRASLQQIIDCWTASRLILFVDMAPNMSGMTVTDQTRAMYLAEIALDFVRSHLKPGGDFLVKVFHGEGFDDYVREARRVFTKVVVRKPDASRSRSRESVAGQGHKVELN